MVKKDTFRYMALLNKQISDDFLIHEILKDVEPVKIDDSDTLFVFCQRGMGYYRKLYILLAHALSKRGYPSIFLFKDNFLSQYIPKELKFLYNFCDKGNILFNNFEIETHFPRLIIDGNEISNSLVEEKSKIKITNGKERKIQYNWTIDLQNEVAEAEGVNFFPIIHNTLRKIFKRYNIDYENDEVLKITESMIKSCELLYYYFKLLKKYSKDNGTKIRIVGWETNYIPNLVFRFLCDYLSHDRDLEYISLARGYNKYFGYHLRESNIVSSNLTKSKKQSRIVINNNEFEQIKNKYDSEKIISEARKIVKEPLKKNFNTEQKKVLELINKYKKSGKNVFCLFTHLFYDTPIDDSSPFFKNMCEWIKDTIAFFKKREDLLLLKPHPVEIRPDYPWKEPNETLSSFLKAENIDLSENIILLEPRLFGLNEIAPFTDCGLIWRSSAAMELAFYNIPCIIAGSPLYKILKFYYPRDKNNYYNLINNLRELNVTEKLKLDVSRYIFAIKEKHIYIKLIAYDKKMRTNYLDKNKINYYLKNGDNKINILLEDLIKRL